MRPALRCPSSVRSFVPARAPSLAAFRSAGLIRFPDAVRGDFGDFKAPGCEATRIFLDCDGLDFAIPESSGPLLFRHNPRRRWRASRYVAGGDAGWYAPGVGAAGQRRVVSCDHQRLPLGHGTRIHAISPGASPRICWASRATLVRSVAECLSVAKSCQKLCRDRDAPYRPRPRGGFPDAL